MMWWEEFNQHDEVEFLFAFKETDIPETLESNQKAKNIIKQYSEYESARICKRTLLNPFELEFIPKWKWEKSKKTLPLEKLVESFFRHRSSVKIRFEHKLWNALQITKSQPELFKVIGVIWVTDSIIKVHKEIFGRFLGLKKITSALFTSQGSFHSHGFVELAEKDIKARFDRSDSNECRFFEHIAKIFIFSADELEISSCHWKSFEV